MADGLPTSPQDSLFSLRVQGTDGFHHGSTVRAFDETYEIRAEHPQVALEKLVQEIEWSILDIECDFTITVAVAGEEAG